MGFTTTCFIRKTTPKLTVELDKLGYRMGFVYSKEQTQIDSILCIQGEFRFPQNSLIDIIKKDIPSVIDCGENEELFLAIAAIRDDTDKEQWFTDGDKWILCPEIKFSTYWACNYISVNLDTIHKASVEELMEHFKKREE